jgi:hypothetical protein
MEDEMAYCGPRHNKLEDTAGKNPRLTEYKLTNKINCIGLNTERKGSRLESVFDACEGAGGNAL